MAQVKWDDWFDAEDLFMPLLDTWGSKMQREAVNGREC